MISFFARQLRAETPKQCQGIRKDLPELKQKLSGVKLRYGQLEKMREKELQALENSRVALVEMVNEIAEKMKQKHKEITQNELRSIENEENDKNIMLEHLVKTITSLDTNIGAYSDYDLIEMQQRMMTEVEQLHASNVEKRENIFTPGSIDSTALEQMVGIIQTDTDIINGETEKRPKLCHIVKRRDFKGFGFNINCEIGKVGQYIGVVAEGSPAKAAGLKEGDRIIEVNRINIENENHQQVVKRIQAKNDVKLLVVDDETFQFYRKMKKEIRGDLPEVLKLSSAIDARKWHTITVDKWYFAI